MKEISKIPDFDQEATNPECSVKRLWPVILAVPVLAGAAFLLFSNSLESPFVSDDIYYIQRSQVVLNFSFPKGLTSLRPLNKATYRLNQLIHGSSLPGYHLVNISLHASAGILLFFLLRRLLRDYGPKRVDSGFLAFGGALLFVVHPLHSQAVNYTFARSELLCAVFLFAALFLHAKKEVHRYGYSRAVWVSLLFLLALASKERAFMFVPALVLFDLVVRRDEGKAERYRRWHKLAVPMSVAIILGLVNLFIGFEKQHTGGFGEGFEVLELLPYSLTEMMVRLYYLKLYVWPGDLSFYHYFVVREELGDPVFWAAVGGHVAILALALFFLRREGRISFGIFWYFLLLLPSAGLVPAALLMHEQWIYISSFGVILVVMTVLQRVLFSVVWTRVAAAALIILCIFLGWMSFRRNEVWQDSVTLWQDACRKSPDMQWVWNNLGVAYLEKGDYREALFALDKVEELGLPSAASHLNIGLCYMHLEEHDEALKRLQAARALYPDRMEILAALGQLYRRMGKHQLAIEHYLAAGKMGHRTHELYLEMAEHALSTDQKEKAVEYLTEGARHFPTSTEIKEMLDRLQEEGP